MTMQRRHFELIAEIIHNMPSFAASLRTQRESCAHAFADGLRASNPSFNRARFLKACGVED